MRVATFTYMTRTKQVEIPIYPKCLNPRTDSSWLSVSLYRCGSEYLREISFSASNSQSETKTKNNKKIISHVTRIYRGWRVITHLLGQAEQNRILR